MLKKVDIGIEKKEIFGNPTPLGLIGLAIGCAVLAPIAFGEGHTPEGLKTAAVWCLLFGAGCQMLSGLMNFANKNVFGGTIFTAFSFLWMVNAWSLYVMADGMVPHHAVILAADGALLIIFAVLTYGFAYFSSLLFVFLLDIDALFICRIVKTSTGTGGLDIPIAVLTIILGVLALWLAFGSLINPVSGKTLFPMGRPLFIAPQKESFYWGVRYNLFEVLYNHWKENAFDQMPMEELQKVMRIKVGSRTIVPDLCYLDELGYAVLALDDEKKNIVSARLSAAGIDLYEQLVLRKYEWPGI
ncbi:MAG: GPR1/FUN34/YaaH family transporter [Pseudomonadota bacterium]